MPLPKQHDEFADLTRSVNEMAERPAHLQETVEKTERLRLIGQLSSGLAHQLRNAVTGAKLAVQLHASECPLADAEALQVTLRQLTLMERTSADRSIWAKRNPARASVFGPGHH